MNEQTHVCECGHKNKEGTEMCAACGKPLTEKARTEGVNMRYEGAAIRSKKRKVTVLDRIWGFFSSVKVGVWIIVLLLLASGVGTIFPQNNYISGEPEVFYEQEYGIFGLFYYKLGLHELYSSWWYIALIVALGISIIVASIDRGVPLYKALKSQRVTRHKHFMTRQRLFSKTAIAPSEAERAIAEAAERLKQKRYRIRVENGNVLAEKNRFARWGPYVNHLGLILFLIGCLLRYIPGMYVDTQMWVREGEQSPIPETDGYFIENRGFKLELYDENDERFQDAFASSNAVVPETFETDAVLYKRQESGIVGESGELEQVQEKKIRVNDPLKFDSFSLYQMDYRLNELHEMTFTLEHKDTGDTFGELTVNLLNPEEFYDLGDGYAVELADYYPDFHINNNKEPATRSSVPNNPYFVFKMYTPDTPDGETSMVGIQQNLEPLGENKYKMTFVDVDLVNVSILTVRKDLTMPLLIAGGSIFIIGLIQGSYWAHRRVWLQQVGGEVWIAGHTNRNWLSFKREIDDALEGNALTAPVDQEEEAESRSEGA
ncbi:cytochrome c biogenesis protein ResB [Shouchella clausii]|uniref:cytochrome c biogenesis protein ResB n=1 Tax=Shouchella clausii TaxID=79880 RepID=UPI000B978972|nr:cytochrome c biogenesis protein ResB [Shouchella clausii]AST97941.1 cytochrome C biogenesis protein [Shouchella clausii]MEB5475354.1 cytochrome c biogenesis protein ResB [Shouchella clausii]QNM44384.1 cytochrome C biogenesis protein [Shouchella clausii]WQG96922.1 cytochrome c biogenesis protein ResB [Shouchella clausii]